MTYSTLFFDLDGTLIDTLEDLTYSLNLILKQEGYPARSLNDVKNGIGEGYRVLIEKCLPLGVLDGEIDRCTVLFEDCYKDHMMENTKPYDGILDLLHEVRKQGMNVAVISNKMNEATQAICDHYFGMLVDLAVGDTNERRKKPATDNVLEAQRVLGAKKEDILYIGDSNIDVQTARNAGISFLGVSWGYRSKEILLREGASLIVDRPNEILDYLNSCSER